MSAYGTGQLSAATVFPQAEQLERDINALRQGRAEHRREQLSLVREPMQASLAWDGLDVDQRRAIARVLLQAVVVKPASRRGNKYDVSRIDPVPQPTG